MNNKETLTLMYKDFEVLVFEVDYLEERIHLIEKLEHFDKAPYKVAEGKNIDVALLYFFNSRAIPSTRKDYEKIINATGSKNGFELSFKGHGLSLANHYWYKREGESLKYDDINFFENGWDDTFGKAVLNGNYEALKNCDLNVPDVVTSGWGVKGWLYEDKPKLYKLGIDDETIEEAVCEVLASRVGSRLFKQGEVLKYELKEINGRKASVCESVIKDDEELVPMSAILPVNLHNLYRNKGNNKDFSKEFFDILIKLNRLDLYNFFAKVACFRSLCFISDLHLDNLCAIRNVLTNEIKVAPIMDLGGAFGSTKQGKDLIANANKGTLIIVYFLFSNFDKDWDYSWYDPNSLRGVEEEIKEYLSKTTFYNQDIISNVLDVYHHLKKTLDEMKEGKA